MKSTRGVFAFQNLANHETCPMSIAVAREQTNDNNSDNCYLKTRSMTSGQTGIPPCKEAVGVFVVSSVAAVVLLRCVDQSATSQSEKLQPPLSEGSETRLS